MSEDERFEDILKKLGLSSKEEAIAQAIAELSDEDKVKMFSEIFPFEDEQISVLLVIGNRYNLSWLSHYLFEKLLLRVSLLRQGRREFVKMIGGKETSKSRFGFWRRGKEKE